MRHKYSSSLFGLLVLAGVASGNAAQAQGLSFPASSASITTSTFAPLGTTATTIPVADVDDANSSAQSIGFTFGFNGQTFTQFVLNTNGVMKLGSTPLSDDIDYFESTNDPADVNLLMPFHGDLVGTSSSYKFATTGTAPNRVCTIEWSNMTEYVFGTPEQFTNFSFQVKLYETSNRIEFVYGPATLGSAAEESYAAIGLKGPGPDAGEVLLATKAANTAAAAATFQTTPYSATTFDYDISSLPTAGLTFRFTPTVTAVKDAQLTQAISVYPNPAVGQATLAANGAGGALQVEVLNTLGQRVYQTTARDNFSTPLNLSHLRAGLYHVKVSNGSRYTVSPLIIQK